MNVSYKIVLILLLPIYTQAMEPEQGKDDNIGKGTPGIAYMANLMEQQSNPIVQRQSIEMQQDPTGSHRQRRLTSDNPNPNPAALARTPTSTTDGSTPDASIPGSIATSKVQLPGLPASVSRTASPNTSANLLPGLNLLNASSSNLLASTIPSTVYNGPGDAEFNEIFKDEVLELFEKCPFMFTPPVKKRLPKITQSSDDKSSGGEKSAEEKPTPKKSRSGTGLLTEPKELPMNKKEFYQDLISKISKALLIKLNMMHHDNLYGRNGLAPVYTFLGINMAETSATPRNSLSTVLKPVMEDALTDHKTTKFKKDCCMYTFMGINIAMSTAAFAVALANYYS